SRKSNAVKRVAWCSLTKFSTPDQHAADTQPNAHVQAFGRMPGLDSSGLHAGVRIPGAELEQKCLLSIPVGIPGDRTLDGIAYTLPGVAARMFGTIPEKWPRKSEQRYKWKLRAQCRTETGLAIRSF
ncbi:MAG: hypothetical protein Q8M31_17285, partial [Beijerinckiaceae bacterium]|nr:hypothetical protein [Beijerinckiaceae bacterium]